ncbi:MAG: hypothetical protein GC136_00355 [Alphaproteobacteria bacterium]|nr:hypothetical protein [Alphaproteobacteria bacterium]
MKSKTSYERGVWAEFIALVYFLLRGFWPVALRFKTKVGEIDLICRKGDLFLFVEVKARTSISEGLFALRKRQESRLVRAAEAFLASRSLPLDSKMRFDLFVITPRFQIEHVSNIMMM